jgi:stage V sporulation protein SpoVS
MATRFVDNTTPLSAANINALDRGGNVYQSAVGGLKVDISAVRVRETGTGDIDYAGATEQAVTGSATNRVFLNSSGTLVIQTGAFPSYPGTIYYPLAEVVTDGSGVTSITDKRIALYA